MASLLWPTTDGVGGTFPQRPRPDQFEHILPTISETFEPDLGPMLVRRLVAKGVQKWTTLWDMNQFQLKRLEQFWNNLPTMGVPGCAGGSVRFNLPHPWDTTRTIEALMFGPPTINGRSGQMFLISIVFMTDIEV